ncbi:hypothetical protein GCM10027445_40580 [Amycolatopsis endophytica]|uniref:ABC-type enterobactin transport system permease subunit n=1 Tax=Amycolatopsis endophytica TaxID=860233 RepID=A0A853B8N9_9PSEU|nr:ABC-type enterobactin transport system permease subunit [Amycolatopsis endophytica]
MTTGVRLGRLQLLLVLAGTGGTATVTATTGPIAFIALTARTSGVACLVPAEPVCCPRP